MDVSQRWAGLGANSQVARIIGQVAENECRFGTSGCNQTTSYPADQVRNNWCARRALSERGNRRQARVTRNKVRGVMSGYRRADGWRAGLHGETAQRDR